MPRGDNRHNRQPAGPSRSTRRSSSPRPQPAPAARKPSTPEPGETRTMPRPRRGFVVTQRLLVFSGVVILLALSFVTSLRVYIVQTGDLALARQQIEERTAQVATLQSELDRWSDDSYVKAQARDRLGWVFPGEVGYRVIGRDGEVVAGTSEIQGIGTDAAGATETWWERLAGSIEAADQPVSGKP